MITANDVKVGARVRNILEEGDMSGSVGTIVQASPKGRSFSIHWDEEKNPYSGFTHKDYYRLTLVTKLERILK